jgi:hypothetical protein
MSALLPLCSALEGEPWLDGGCLNDGSLSELLPSAKDLPPNTGVDEAVPGMSGEPRQGSSFLRQPGSSIARIFTYMAIPLPLAATAEQKDGRRH